MVAVLKKEQKRGRQQSGHNRTLLNTLKGDINTVRSREGSGRGGKRGFDPKKEVEV